MLLSIVSIHRVCKPKQTSITAFRRGMAQHRSEHLSRVLPEMFLGVAVGKTAIFFRPPKMEPPGNLT